MVQVDIPVWQARNMGPCRVRMGARKGCSKFKAVNI
uniref:Uncharacterized protein n=1 Tax=Tetraselmis sp. GSL018 TaxID=582737 RepID=A0A061SAV9_9CHLO